jgi:6-phosphogluconolactonase
MGVIMGTFQLEKLSSPQELATRAAAQWLDQLAKRGPAAYHAALSGGRIARDFFRSIAERLNQGQVSLAQVHFIWADERCVPPDDPESNYRLALEQLFRPARIPEQQIHRIRGEEKPEEAAEIASDEIRRIVPLNNAGWPVLDMIFLGMGEDGHVASLFPPVQSASGANPYLTVMATKPPPARITFRYEVLTAAKQVWVLASGAGKEAALRESISGRGQTPLGEVIRKRGETRILTDIRF